MKLKLNRAVLATAATLPLLLSSAPSSKADSTTESSMTQTNVNLAEADNSKRNARDRDNNSMTSGDQGNSQSDLDVTRQIRRAVVSSTNNFSVMAHNIKIITVNGKVTLRGPVETTEEKERIAVSAENIAGANNVTDQLEVKSNP